MASSSRINSAYLVGIAFPLQFDRGSDIVLNVDESVLNDDIQLATFIRPYGIPLYPLGVGAEEFVFDPLDDVLETELEVHISDGLSESVDGIVVEGSFSFKEDENTLEVVVPYLNVRTRKNQQSVLAIPRAKVD